MDWIYPAGIWRSEAGGLDISMDILDLDFKFWLGSNNPGVKYKG
jgi:hypothetical protein